MDVLVLYTTKARDGAGGEGRVRAAILEAFEMVNRIHENSLTGVRLLPVAVLEAEYAESGSILTDLNALEGFGRTLRSTYRADLVVMVSESDDLGLTGAASVAMSSAFGRPDSAYAVVSRRTPFGLGSAIAEETAHLMGCQRDGANGVFPYSRGHHFVADGIPWATATARVSGMRIPYFSNPDVTYRGRPTGVREGQPGAADAAATIRRVAPVVSRYERCTNRVEFEVTRTSVRQDAGTLRLKLIRTGPEDTLASLWVRSLEGSAVGGTHFVPVAEEIEFAMGQREREIEVSLLQDGEGQGRRTFRLQLQNPGPGTGAGSNREIQVNLVDDGTAFELTADEVSVGEGGQAATVQVRRIGSLELPASVQLNLLPTGEAAGIVTLDVGTVEGASPPVALNFDPGESAIVVRIRAPDDAVAGPDRRVTLHLVGASGADTNRGTHLSVLIRDNDRRDRLETEFNSSELPDEIEGPVLSFPDGGFLLGIRSGPGGAITLTRFTADGSLDTGFHPVRFQEAPEEDAGLEFGRLARIVAQDDGKILVAGYFVAVNGEVHNGLVRLLPDGTPDSGFQTGAGFSGPVHDVCVQPDGRIVVVGEFTHVDRVARSYAARLHADGTRDTSFHPEFYMQPGIIGGSLAWLHAVAMQGDRILIGGRFSGVNLQAARFLVRLLPDGSLDRSFRADLNGVVSGLRVLPGGAFIATGSFPVPGPWADRFLADGRLDVRHRLRGLNGPVDDVLPLSGGGTLLAGRFLGATNGPLSLAKLLADGSVDASFAPRLLGSGRVTALIPGPNGDLTLLGSLRLASGDAARPILRIRSGAPAPELTTLQTLGSALRVEALTVRGLTHRLERTADFVRWEPVDSGNALTSTGWFEDPAPLAQGYYRLRAGSESAAE